MPEIIASKLLPPYAGTNLIERPRLLELLRNQQRKATIIAAPAGYGKTVLMVQLAAACKKPLVWYQVDDYDNDPAVFMQYLIAGIQQHDPDFGTDVTPIVAQGNMTARLRLLVTAVVNGLEKQVSRGLVIALDDYHAITEPVIHSFIQELLYHLPSGIQIMIASRTTPPLPLSRLNLLGEVCAVGAEELRFTYQEIGAFMALSCGEITDTTIKILEDKTAGWPAALRLLGNASSAAAGLPPNHGAQKIYDYLAAEVFNRQPETVRAFLLGTAVLEEITPAFCDLLLARTDSREMLDFLEKQQLFLIPLAGKKQAYRYHDLFREFLQDRLGPESQALLRLAGLLARQAGELESAVEYLTAAGAPEETLDVIKAAGKQAFDKGQWQTVARWLEHLSAAALADEPWLALYQAKVEVCRGRLDEAESWVNEAAALFIVSGEHAGLAESKLLQARIMRCRGHYANSLALLEQTMRQMSREEIAHRFDLTMERSLCLLLNGQLNEAEAVLTAALAAAKLRNDNYMIAHLLEGLANVYSVQGKYSQSLRSYQKAAEISPKQVLPSYYMADFISFIYLDWGECEQALDYAKRNVAIKEKFGLTDALPPAYHQLATVYSSQGELQLAEKYFTRAISLLQENNGERFHLAISLIHQADCLFRQGRCIEARIKAEEALAAAGPQSGIALAICQAMSAVIFFQIGDTREGKELLAAATRDFEHMGLRRGRGFVYSFHALLCFNEANIVAAREWAEKAFGELAGFNCQRFFLDHYIMLQPVLTLGLENGYEVSFVQRVLVRLGEQALEPLACITVHADPEVRCRAIAPLAEIGGPQAEDIICRLTEDSNREVRRLAHLAGQRLGILAVAETSFETVPTLLQVVTFGQFRVCLGATGESVTNWRTAKTRDLFVYFCHRREPVSKEEILEDLWPDLDVESATGLLHTTLYYLRQLLDKAGCREAIRYNGRRYQLRPGSFSCDRQQFEELAQAGLRFATDPETSAVRLEQAVSLYCGHYLGDMDYSWLIPDQEKLKHSCIQARMRLASYYLEAQDYSRAIAHLQTVEEYSPFDEEVTGLLMTAYARQGNRSAVKRQYQKLEAVLKNELGLLPSRAICDLCRKLMK